jgi:hypothetical protein
MLDLEYLNILAICKIARHLSARIDTLYSNPYILYPLLPPISILVNCSSAYSNNALINKG